MEWATTVVRLPARRGPRRVAARATSCEFPSQFLVFSPHIAELVLDDRVRDKRRSIQLQKGEVRSSTCCSRTGPRTSGVCSPTEFEPSVRRQRKDGGAMAHREIIRLQWAVPVRARQRIGGLWAYFPTLEETTLSGVINAPWKLNDDRTRVIEGPFNREILEHACDTVLHHLEVLTTQDDPGNVLDILPARGTGGTQLGRRAPD